MAVAVWDKITVYFRCGNEDVTVDFWEYSNTTTYEYYKKPYLALRHNGNIYIGDLYPAMPTPEGYVCPSNSLCIMIDDTVYSTTQS